MLRSLKPGDNVRIVCTARSARAADLQPAIALLKQWGFMVSLGDTIDQVENQFGGSREERLADFQNAWNDPTVHAIWIARGGYGSVQIIDAIEFSQVIHAPNSTQKQISDDLNDQRIIKPVIGYSDVTLIHGKLQSLGLPSIHAFMPLEIPTRSTSSIESLKKVMIGKGVSITLRNDQKHASQRLNGILYGGNLSILYSLLGSDLFPDTTDGILFIEDIDEYLYHIERMMYSLKRAGKLSHLKALLVGGMTGMNDHEIPFGKDVKQIIQDVCAGSSYPVLFDIPAGHVVDNQSLILGADLTIDITTKYIQLKQ